MSIKDSKTVYVYIIVKENLKWNKATFDNIITKILVITMQHPAKRLKTCILSQRSPSKQHSNIKIRSEMRSNRLLILGL